MPHHTTWSRILGRAVDIPALEHRVSRLLTPLALGEVPERWSIAVALDGKTIRDTIPRGQSHDGVHLLAASVPRREAVLAQIAVATKENEIVAAPTCSRTWT